jgi:phosphoribosylanthranilate isomerase
MTKVKICGITNLEDALLSAKFGADALGFNFYEKSPRYIAPEKAREICAELPPEVLKVGVFVNEDLDKILEIAELVILDAIQLHGDETPEFISEAKQRYSGKVIKALRVSESFVPEDVLQFSADAILLDAFSKQEYGGTGETFDWKIARKVQELFPKMYLAGGLSSKNVEEAIKIIEPYGVDACSCLEVTKGKKNNDEVYRFFNRIYSLGSRYSKRLFPFFNKADEREFSIRLKNKFPNIFFIDDDVWESSNPPTKNFIDECNSKFVFIWNKDIVNEPYAVTTDDGKCHESKVVDVIGFTRSYMKSEGLWYGEILFSSNSAYPNFEPMKNFTKEVWKILNKMCEKVVTVDPQTKAMLNNDVPYFRVGKNTVEWCKENSNNFLCYYKTTFLPKSFYE